MSRAGAPKQAEERNRKSSVFHNEFKTSQTYQPKTPSRPGERGREVQASMARMRMHARNVRRAGLALELGAAQKHARSNPSMACMPQLLP